MNKTSLKTSYFGHSLCKVVGLKICVHFSSVITAVLKNHVTLAYLLVNCFSIALWFAGVSKDELFGQFFAALEKFHYFRTMPDGNDDPSQVDKASRIFHDAINVWHRFSIIFFCCFFWILNLLSSLFFAFLLASFNGWLSTFLVLSIFKE